MSYCIALNKLDRLDTAIAGGKGAMLGELINLGFTVPEGFVINTKLYNKYFKKQIPQNIKNQILKEFKNLNSKFVAVRSSAVCEDSYNSSWAGQFETYLGVSENLLIDKIISCWQSSNSKSAKIYTKNTDTKKIEMAVVVQKMVNSQISGISFSIHPVTKNRNHLIIESALGLGDKIASGQITPQRFIVDKNRLQIIDEYISLQDSRLLSNLQIIDLSKLVINLENHFKFAVDIEWAIEDGKIYLIQCRPITTLNGRIKDNS